MEGGQSLLVGIPPGRFASLFQEVRRNGGKALANRRNSAIRFRTEGAVEAAETAEQEAKIMEAIAQQKGVKL